MDNAQAFKGLDYIEEQGLHIHDALVSYYYLEKGKTKAHEWELIHRNCDNVMVDSGAHSFQVGKTVDWYNYTERYAQWVADHKDDPRFVGFFEMDVDIVLGYEKVKELQNILFQASDKIIPVWHKNRGIDEFKRMCHETKGDIVAITGFRNEDIIDKQYPAFVKYAWSCGKKIHCLGMTRKKILDKVPFDYVDSSSWKQAGIYGNRLHFKNGQMVTKSVHGRYTTTELNNLNLVEYMKFAEYYNAKWHRINHDLYENFNWQWWRTCTKPRKEVKGMKKRKSTIELAKVGVTTALYVVLSLLVAPFSFGAIQLRLSEMFNHLIIFNKRYILSMILGCFIVNLFSPLGVIDLVFGVAGTVLSSLGIYTMNKVFDKFELKGGLKVKLLLSSVISAITMFPVAIELVIVSKVPFWATYATTALGELISCLFGAVVVYELNKRVNLSE